MRRSSVALLTLLFACTGGTSGVGVDDSDDVGGDTDDPGATETPGVDSASCEVAADNGLLVRCSVTLESAGTTNLSLTGDGVPSRSFQSESGTELEVVGWGLKAETEYDWDIGGVQGTVTTGSIPSNLSAADIRISGTPEAFDAVLLPMTCTDQYFAMIDGDGDIVWYLENALYQSGMDAYEWNQDDLSLLIGNDGNVVEWSVQHEQLNVWNGYTGLVHHDLARWNGYTYLLYNYETGNSTVDAVHVFDGLDLLGTFDFDDHYDTAVQGGGGPGQGNNEWGHANGINPSADGQMVVSLLMWDSVVAFDADPDSANFLGINWVVAGDNEGLPDADYTPAGGGDEGFGRQHNASWVDGKLWLFDNDGTGGESRVARYNLNDNSGEVELEEDWGVESSCNIEGGAIALDGGVLGTCATSRDIFEFKTGSETPVFELNAGCGGGGGGPGGGGGEPMNRGMPVVY